jgi:hypothetical protein
MRHALRKHRIGMPATVTDDYYKSSFSGNAGCVTVQFQITGQMVNVRDSKVTNGPELTFTPLEWAAFIAGAKAGEFDIPGEWIGKIPFQLVLHASGGY